MASNDIFNGNSFSHLKTKLKEESSSFTLIGNWTKKCVFLTFCDSSLGGIILRHAFATRCRICQYVRRLSPFDSRPPTTHTTLSSKNYCPK
ncbi:hypothetical protein PIB30_093865, partial [Stylosanthes scabra]|nr:hypothetical protein [Stylosanthes scabra]